MSNIETRRHVPYNQAFAKSMIIAALIVFLLIAIVTFVIMNYGIMTMLFIAAVCIVIGIVLFILFIVISGLGRWIFKTFYE